MADRPAPAGGFIAARPGSSMGMRHHPGCRPRPVRTHVPSLVWRRQPRQTPASGWRQVTGWWALGWRPVALAGRGQLRCCCQAVFLPWVKRVNPADARARRRVPGWQQPSPGVTTRGRRTRRRTTARTGDDGVCLWHASWSHAACLMMRPAPGVPGPCLAGRTGPAPPAPVAARAPPHSSHLPVKRWGPCTRLCCWVACTCARRPLSPPRNDATPSLLALPVSALRSHAPQLAAMVLAPLAALSLPLANDPTWREAAASVGDQLRDRMQAAAQTDGAKQARGSA